METVKYDLKLFAADGPAFDPAELVPLFHGWIRGGALDELLIDVADYRHVHHGPAVVLIAHDAHYAWDLAGGRPGLLYSRRRETHPAVAGLTTPQERLRSVFRSALAAARRLEEEPTLAGRLRFAGDELLLRINDRLAASDTAATEAAIRPLLEPLLAQLYPGAAVDVERLVEPDGLFSLRLEASESPSVAGLLDRLGGGEAPAASARGVAALQGASRGG